MSMTEETTSKRTDTKEQVREKAGEMADRAQEHTRAQAAAQKDRAADKLSGVARALRSTSDSLREEDDQTAARYIDQAAGQVDRMSGYLREHSTGDLVRDTERFARRQPALFFGGAFALGLLGARFLKSSGPDSSHVREPYERRPGATPSGKKATTSSESSDATSGS